MCACCLVEYYSQLFAAISRAQNVSEADLKALAISANLGPWNRSDGDLRL